MISCLEAAVPSKCNSLRSHHLHFNPSLGTKPKSCGIILAPVRAVPCDTQRRGAAAQEVYANWCKRRRDGPRVLAGIPNQ
jgi:hypothetical protein